jgi:hypothetical protein
MVLNINKMNVGAGHSVRRTEVTVKCALCESMSWAMCGTAQGKRAGWKFTPMKQEQKIRLRKLQIKELSHTVIFTTLL